MFAAMILYHMENQAYPDDLEELCNDIGKIQRLSKVNGKSDRSSDNGGKETQLNSAEDGETFKGICGNYKTRCEYKRKDFPKKKSRGNGGGSGGGGNGNYGNHCKTKDHDKDGS